MSQSFSILELAISSPNAIQAMAKSKVTFNVSILATKATTIPRMLTDTIPRKTVLPCHASRIPLSQFVIIDFRCDILFAPFTPNNPLHDEEFEQS